MTKIANDNLPGMTANITARIYRPFRKFKNASMYEGFVYIYCSDFEKEIGNQTIIGVRVFDEDSINRVKHLKEDSIIELSGYLKKQVRGNEGRVYAKKVIFNYIMIANNIINLDLKENNFQEIKEKNKVVIKGVLLKDAEVHVTASNSLIKEPYTKKEPLNKSINRNNELRMADLLIYLKDEVINDNDDIEIPYEYKIPVQLQGYKSPELYGAKLTKGNFVSIVCNIFSYSLNIDGKCYKKDYFVSNQLPVATKFLK